MVHQHPLVVGALTVAENFSLGGLGDGSPASMLEAVADVVQTIPLEVDPRARIDSLPMSLRQRVEIVRCLAHGVRVLVLDEPTAVLTPDEVQQLFGEMERVVEQGRSVIFITHKLAEVQTIAQRVTVLRHGRNVGSFAVGDITSAELAEQMVGRELSDRSAKGAPRAAGAARVRPCPGSGSLRRRARRAGVRRGRSSRRDRGTTDSPCVTPTPARRPAARRDGGRH